MLLVSLTQMSLVNGESHLATVLHGNTSFFISPSLGTWVVHNTHSLPTAGMRLWILPRHFLIPQPSPKTQHVRGYMELCYCLWMKNGLAWSPTRRIYSAAQPGNRWEAKGSIASITLVQHLPEPEHLCLAAGWNNTCHSHSLACCNLPLHPEHLSGLCPLTKGRQTGLLNRAVDLVFQCSLWKVPTITSP